MEKVLESLKNLYRGEDVVRKHLLLTSVFILPALLSGISAFVDKDVPAPTLIVLGVCALVFFILSIVPWFCLLGYNISFVESRMMKNTGIPAINLGMVWEGVKVFPLVLVWTIYFMFLWIVLLVLPFIPMIVSGKAGTAEVLIGVLGFILAIFVVMVLTFILMPFLNYVVVEYVKYGNQGYLYSPATLFNFMKKSFKETMLVFLKFLLVSLIVNIPVGVLNMALFAIIFSIGVFMGVGSADNESLVIPPALLVVGIILGSFVGIIQMYVSTMVSNAATENYIDVYNTVIEPEVENTEDV